MHATPPGLIEVADVQTPVRRRLPKAARAGLIAACLCLALIGTAAAVHYSGIRAEVRDDGNIYLSGGIIQHSYDSLSDELKALEGEISQQSFSSWQEMEDFIGFDLMNNPLLDANPSYRDYSISEGGHSVTGRYLLSISAGQDRMYPLGRYYVDGFDVILRGNFYTDHIPEDLKEFYEKEWDSFIRGTFFNENNDIEHTLEVYTAPSGLEAQIVTDRFPDSSFCLETVFSINGTAFEMTTFCSESELDEARAVTARILDGFVLR
ncbi:MAG: hypothetical protein K2K53_08880, partial [Oscillospiraceae bacterium]|nr:hypothetical protein [Oscillospiraceae bacterium]